MGDEEGGGLRDCAEETRTAASRLWSKPSNNPGRSRPNRPQLYGAPGNGRVPFCFHRARFFAAADDDTPFFPPHSHLFDNVHILVLLTCVCVFDCPHTTPPTLLADRNLFVAITFVFPFVSWVFRCGPETQSRLTKNPRKRDSPVTCFIDFFFFNRQKSVQELQISRHRRWFHQGTPSPPCEYTCHIFLLDMKKFKRLKQSVKELEPFLSKKLMKEQKFREKAK